MYKFGSVGHEGPRPYLYPDVWAIQHTTGPDRLIIAPTSGHIDLMVECAGCWSPGYGILYVLLLSRLGNRPGRYQSPGPITRDDLHGFDGMYRGTLQSDGRPHCWLGPARNEG